MSTEPLYTFGTSLIRREPSQWGAKDTPLQKAVIIAYDAILFGIMRLWLIDFNEAWKKFPSNSHLPSTEPGVDKFIYMNFCNIKLIWGKFGYSIIVTLPQESFTNGSNLKTNKMMQIAFDVVKHGPGKLFIEDRLQFRITDNVRAVYDQMVVERSDKENQDYINKKLKIEG